MSPMPHGGSGLMVLDRASVEAGGVPLVKAASLSVGKGELVALVGPNGAGKSSLLRLMLGLIAPSAGSASIDGMAAHRMAPADRARRIAYLPQLRPLAWPHRVADVVALGRFAHGAAPGRLSAADARAVDAALAATDLTALAGRRADRLSGGEAARMHLARALAAGTPMLVADEPVAALDPLHQLEALGVLRRYVADGGGALVVLHDLDLAARFADRLVWMKGGQILADGPVAHTLTADLIEAVHGITAHLVEEDGVRRVLVGQPVPG